MTQTELRLTFYQNLDKHLERLINIVMTTNGKNYEEIVKYKELLKVGQFFYCMPDGLLSHQMWYLYLI